MKKVICVLLVLMCSVWNGGVLTVLAVEKANV